MQITWLWGNTMITIFNKSDPFELDRWHVNLQTIGVMPSPRLINYEIQKLWDKYIRM